MTQTTLLSARIIELEKLVLRGQEDTFLLVRAAQERADLEEEMDALARGVNAGEEAERLLKFLQLALARAEGQPADPSTLVDFEDVRMAYAPPRVRPVEQAAAAESVLSDPPAVDPAPAGPAEETDPAAANPSDDDEDRHEPGGDDDQQDDEDTYVSDKDRVRASLMERLAEPGVEFAAADFEAELGIPRKSVGQYLRGLAAEGLIVKVPGTGTHKVPNRYHPAGGGETPQTVPDVESPKNPSVDMNEQGAPPAIPDPAPAPPEASVPTAPPSSRASAVPPVREAARTMPRDLPPQKADAGAPNEEHVAAVFNFLHEHGRPVSANMVINRLPRLGLKFDALVKVLDHLIRDGRAEQTPERLYQVAQAWKAGAA